LTFDHGIRTGLGAVIHARLILSQSRNSVAPRVSIHQPQAADTQSIQPLRQLLGGFIVIDHQHLNVLVPNHSGQA